jgi:hypothetical protein
VFVLKWEILWEIEEFEYYRKMAALQFKVVGVRSVWCSYLRSFFRRGMAGNRLLLTTDLEWLLCCLKSGWFC